MANKAGAGKPPPSPPPADHNQNPSGEPAAPAPLTQEDREALFTKHLVQARTDEVALEKAKEIVRGVMRKRKANRALCRQDGFPLKWLDEILEDEKLTTVDREKDAEVRTFMRITANQPVIGQRQLDLFAGTHTMSAATAEGEEKGESHWRMLGYDAGFRGLECAPQKLDVPEGEPSQWWMDAWNDGQAKLISRMKRAGEIEKANAEPANA